MSQPAALDESEFGRLLAVAEGHFRTDTDVEAALAPFIVLLQDALVHKRDWSFVALRESGRRLHDETSKLDGNPRVIFTEALRRVGLASRDGEVGAINLAVYCEAGFQHVGDGGYFR